jgi:hypothetical protein
MCPSVSLISRDQTFTLEFNLAESCRCRGGNEKYHDAEDCDDQAESPVLFHELFLHSDTYQSGMYPASR